MLTAGLISTPTTGPQLTRLVPKELLEANLLKEDVTQLLAFSMIARRIQMREMTWGTVYPHLRDVQENRMIIV